MTTQQFGLRYTLMVLRRRWRSLVAILVMSMAFGAFVTSRQTPTFVARSRVLLPPSTFDASGRPLRNMATETYIASSSAVLNRAGMAMNPPVGAQRLSERVSVRVVSSDIIDVRARGRSGRDAALAANAVANEYVAYANSAASDVVDTSVRALQEQATELGQRIRQLEDEIAANTARLVGLDQRTPEGQRQAATIDSLRVAQSDAARQLSSINTRVADARLNADLSRRGLRLLESATAARRPESPRPLWNLAISAVIGAMVGALVVLVLERRNRRLRSRDDVAQAVGAPVVGSLPVARSKTANDYHHLLQRWGPDVKESLSLWQAYYMLGVSQVTSANVVVVTLSGDRSALVLSLKLAAFFATVGTDTAFVVATRHETVSELRSACRSAMANSMVRDNLVVYDSVQELDAEKLGSIPLTVNVVVYENGSPVTFPTWERPTLTVLAASSGFATSDQLASVAVACLDARHPITGVLVANTDPTDKTTGRLGTQVVGSGNGVTRGSGEPPAVLPAVGWGPVGRA